MTNLLSLWLVHPGKATCQAFRERFAGLPRVCAEPKIETVAFPAFGTGFGGVPAGEAARQMAAAWRHCLGPPHRLDWDWVVDRQKAICYDGDKQVVRG